MFANATVDCCQVSQPTACQNGSQLLATYGKQRLDYRSQKPRIIIMAQIEGSGTPGYPKPWLSGKTRENQRKNMENQ